MKKEERLSQFSWNEQQPLSIKVLSDFQRNNIGNIKLRLGDNLRGLGVAHSQTNRPLYYLSV